MPIFEYMCNGCSKGYDVLAENPPDPIPPCPNCGESGYRIWSPPAVIFKGKGFYINDKDNKK